MLGGIAFLLFITCKMKCPCQENCPGVGKLGLYPGALHGGTASDPLETLFAGSSYTLGGAQRYITSLSKAINGFMQREYPDFGPGLTIIPNLPSPQANISWEDLSKHFISCRHGALVPGKIHFSVRLYVCCQKYMKTRPSKQCKSLI